MTMVMAESADLNFSIEDLSLFIKENDKINQEINLKNCIGFAKEDHIFTIRINEYVLDTRGQREKNQHIIKLNEPVFQKLSDDLEDVFEYKKQSERRMLIMINPFSGKKRALQDFNDVVIPMLNEANIQFQSIVTKSKEHVREIIEGIDPSKVNELVLFGGDGLLHEAINIVNKWEQERKSDFLKRITFSVLPGGSANSIAAALLIQRDWHGHSYKVSVENCTFLLIRGEIREVPVCENHLDETTVVLSIEKSAIGFGAVSTYQAENYRRVGPFRYTVAALREIGKCPQYNMPSVMQLREVEADRWPDEYVEYDSKCSMPRDFRRKYRHDDDGPVMGVKDEFTTVTIHNNPAFFETLDPDGAPFVRLEDPFVAFNFIAPTNRRQMVGHFLRVLRGHLEWTQSPLNTIILCDWCLMKFEEPEKVTIDGELYSCVLWEIKISESKLKMTM